MTESTDLTEITERLAKIEQWQREADQQYLKDADDFIQLTEELEKVVKTAVDQSGVISGVILMIEAAMALSKIHHERLTAIEARHRGASLQDIIDGKDLPELGPTRDHLAQIEALSGRFEQMNDAVRKLQDNEG